MQTSSAKPKTNFAGESSGGFPWFWALVLGGIGYAVFVKKPIAQVQRLKKHGLETPDELVSGWYARTGDVLSAEFLSGYTDKPASFWVGKRIGGHIIRRAKNS